MAAPELDVAQLSAGYGRTLVIEDMTFTLPPRQKLAVLGRNGVGKTTLMMALMGLARQRAGSIRLGETALDGLPPFARAARGIGLVPQTRDIFKSLTVEENLAAGLKGRPRAAIDEAYALFPRLKERRRTSAGALSGGEQQMLSCARTLLGEPTILLLDEPLEGLAPVICDELMAAFTRLAAEKGLSVILVEQQIERALDFADRVIFLERGRIAHAGPAADIRVRRDLIERYAGVGMH